MSSTETESARTVLNLADETNAAAATQQVAPVTLGKYQLRQKLGAGAMGAVYLAYDPMIDREVAVKLLPVDVSQDPVALQRFLGEARAAGRLNHPNTIAVYDIGEAEGVHYIVMELARGGSVADLVDGTKRPSFQEACRLIIEAARGLAAAHKQGMIHRDIKPENLMLAEDGTVKIVDFGLSKAVMSESTSQAALTAAGQVMGTPHYMSPEQYQAATLDGRTDMYSLAGTFYRLLTGEFPYGAKSIHQIMYAHLESPPPDPRRFCPQLPPDCTAVIAKAMAKSPNDRYVDMLEFVAAVERLLADPLSGANPAAPPARPTPAVLIVESSKLQARIVKDAFVKAGATSVAVAGSAAEALQAIPIAIPDVIVASRQLPDMPGEGLFQRLDSIPELKRTLFISVTATDHPGEIVTAGIRLAHGHVEKRSGPHDLFRAIHAVTQFRLDQVEFRAAAKKAGARVLIVTDEGKLPPTLEQAVRGARLLDVSVLGLRDVAAGERSQEKFSLVLVAIDVRTFNEGVLAQLRDKALSPARAHAVFAVVISNGAQSHLRFVSAGALQVQCECAMDQDRLERLLTIA